MPEQLEVSNTAELGRNKSEYIVFFSLLLLDGAGTLGQSEMGAILASALYYASVSEIAEIKRRPEFVIKPGQKIALFDPNGVDILLEGRPHPIHLVCGPPLSLNAIIRGRL